MDLRDCIKKAETKAIITIISIITIFYLIWLFPLEHALNKFLTEEQINNFIKNKINISLKLSELKYKTNPNFSLTIQTNQAIVSDDVSEIINTNNFSITINPFNILTQKFSLNSIEGDEVKLNIIKDENGNINILKILPTQKQNKTIQIKKIQTSIKKYVIFYTDKKINQLVNIDGQDFIISDYIANKKIKLSTEGHIITTDKNKNNQTNGSYQIEINSSLPITKNINKKDFILNLNLKDIKLATFLNFTKYIKNSDIIELKGLINANIETKINEENKIKELTGNIITKDLLLLEKTIENTTRLKEEANINFKTQLLSDKIKIETFDLQSKYLNVKTNGEILHTNTNKPYLNINTIIYNNKNGMFYNALPSEIKYEHYLISKLKKYKPKATLNGKLNIKGILPHPEIIGEIKTDDLYIDTPIAKNANAKLKLIFDKKRLNILGKVYTEKNSNVDVNGSLNIYGEKNANFKIKTNNNVDLKTVKAVLIPIQDTFTLNFGIINQLIIQKGFGTAELEISGTRKNSSVLGNLNFNSATAYFEGINALLTETDGYVNFNGKNLEFATTKANIKDQQIKIYGTGSLLGNFDIDISSDSIKTNNLLDILKSSELLKPIIEKNKELNNISAQKGNANVKINIIGNGGFNKKDFDITKINYNGELLLKNNLIRIKNFDFPVNINNAKINFNPNELKSIINAKLLSSPINVDFILNNDNVKLSAKSDKFLLQDIFTIIDKKNEYKKWFIQNNNSSFTKFTTSYNGNTKDIELDKIVLNGTLLSEGIAPFYTSQGEINLANSEVKINNLNLNALESQITIDGVINNIFNKNTDYNLNCNISNLNIAKLNEITQYKLIKNEAKKIISAYEQYKGKINGDLNFQKDKINGKILIRDIGLTHKKLQLPISISNADITFKDSNIHIPKIHGTIDDLPILIKLDIYNLFKKPNFSGYITTNLYPTFVNKYINTNLGYPIKLKGEMQFKSYFNGTSEETKTTTLLNFPVNSDISYMGANIDDKEFDREIKLELTQNKNNFKINNAVISKYIRAQNGFKTNYPYLKASGQVKILPNDIEFKKLNIKTNEPTNSKIFNILFKKSILKYGKFDCDLTLDGTYTNPKILGFINFKNLDMPLYETIVKDIFADFKHNNIALKVLGTIYDTQITGTALLSNNLTPPYHIKNLNINADYLDIDNIFNSISSVSMKSPHNISENSTSENKTQETYPVSLLIDKGNITAKKVLVRGFPATNLEATISQANDNILKVNGFDFNFGEGKVNASAQYNITNNILNGVVSANSIDANQFSQIFLNLKNQIYGNLDGKVEFNTNGITPNERLENLNAKISFNIKDGKMPKLGSLEYLLRAANLVKSGITGFTINNMIDLLIPVKTGNFSNINGNINIKKGIAKDIEITSLGKNLSLYITGKADIMNQNAQMLVFGRLNKKLSTILGPLGNTSLNTLFNFIPGISISGNENQLINEINKIPQAETINKNDFRFFRATIDGDLNSEEFVQTFKWLE